MATDRAPADFGTRLRQARERRGISLRQIASATKISVGALEALERNDLSRLPGGIFSRAFVRAYASEVGLDPEATIQEFLAQLPQDVPAAHLPSAEIEDGEALESQRRTATTFLRLIGISAPIAAFVVYFAASGRLAPEVEPQMPPPSTPAAASRPVPPSAVVPLQSDAVPVSGPAAKSPMAAAPTPAATLPAPQPEATTATLATEPATEDARANNAGRLTIELSVTRPCWLTATVDGRKRIERLLQAGDRESIDVVDELSFTAADAAAVRMTIGGAAARPLGRRGETITVRVTPSNFRSFLPSR